MLGLNHQVNYNGGRIPSITFGVYSQACILIFTPFLWWLYHILEKYGVRVTPLRRIGECGNFSSESDWLRTVQIKMFCIISENYLHRYEK